MKLFRYPASRIRRTNLRLSPAARRRLSRLRKMDKAATPSRADEVRRLTELAKNIPDVRQEKIEAIKSRIESGTYVIPTQSVAKSIIDHHKRIHPDKE